MEWDDCEAEVNIKLVKDDTVSLQSIGERESKLNNKTQIQW